jgi:glyoxylase-like metal-dependent hydrolase (beta-lactamase superfamily II)
VARYRQEGKPELAQRLDAATLVMPTDLLTERVVLELGHRHVELIHPGLGHTDHDVIVHGPDSGVVFAGDLVEEGEPPKVGPDSTPGQAARPRSTRCRAGHGEPVDAEFVRWQRDEVSAGST